MNDERGPASKRNSPSFRKVVFQVGIPQGVAFSISYIEADRELPELETQARYSFRNRESARKDRTENKDLRFISKSGRD